MKFILVNRDEWHHPCVLMSYFSIEKSKHYQLVDQSEMRFLDAFTDRYIITKSDLAHNMYACNIFGNIYILNNEKLRKLSVKRDKIVKQQHCLLATTQIKENIIEIDKKEEIRQFQLTLKIEN